MAGVCAFVFVSLILSHISYHGIRKARARADLRILGFIRSGPLGWDDTELSDWRGFEKHSVLHFLTPAPPGAQSRFEDYWKMSRGPGKWSATKMRVEQGQAGL